MLNLKQAAADAPVTHRGPLPENTLTRVRVEVTDLRKSQSNNDMLNITLHAIGPFNGARILTQIMLTADGGTKPSGIGAQQIMAILSAAGIDVSNDQNVSFPDYRAVATAINGKTGAVKTKINDKGYSDVRMYVAPDQSLGTINDWNTLLASEAPAKPASDGIPTFGEPSAPAATAPAPDAPIAF
jgi:hypothetical protein